MRLKKVENANYFVELCKTCPLKLSMVNIGGLDIVDGKKKMVLSVIWQLIHRQVNFDNKEFNFRRRCALSFQYNSFRLPKTKKKIDFGSSHLISCTSRHQ